jgi:uncharacterized membrane protein
MRISRKLSIILVISIALNLLLGGSIASHWLFRGDSVTAGFRGPLHHTAAREKLSGGNQAKVDQIWHQRRAIHRENIHAMRDARRHVYDAIVADPFDRSTLDIAYADLHQRLLKARTGMARTLGDIAAELPAAERQAYFKEGFRRFKHHRPHKPKLGRIEP